MATFYSVFGFLAVNSFVDSQPGTFDVLSRLPVEMALHILRLLPAKDLLNAVLVSSKWLRLCRRDPKLRQRVRRYLRQMRRATLAVLMGQGARRCPTRDSPAMRNITNAGRSNVSSLRENGLRPDRTVNRPPLSYQRYLVEKPKKRIRNVTFEGYPAKRLRI